MHSKFYVYNLNIIESHSYILLTHKKCLVRISFGKKCKLSMLVYFILNFLYYFLIFVMSNARDTNYFTNC